MKDYDIIIGEKGDDKVLWTYYLVADFDGSFMNYIYEDIMSYLIAHGVVSENAARLRRYEGIENFK